MKSVSGDPASSTRESLRATARTPEEIQKWFRVKGVSVSEWARERGFSPSLTNAIIKGKRRCLRGQSHRIAVALGLKVAEDFEFEDGGPQL